MTKLRPDLHLISEIILGGSTRARRVLDVGCGSGNLLARLREGGIDGRGIELDSRTVADALARGLSVVQGDAARDLADYPSGAFDYAVLSDTLQAMRDPAAVLKELLRIGRRAVVSFPNFGHWRVRASLLVKGRMPVTTSLPIPWHKTPNIHLCTIADFEALIADIGVSIEDAAFLVRGRRIGRTGANWRAAQAIYVLSRLDRPLGISG